MELDATDSEDEVKVELDTTDTEDEPAWKARRVEAVLPPWRANRV